ncbi:PREDICTED: peroxidase 69-like [Tarenaya hassleriana]|uniref:peroxidase 69-like n=1 Tax=Tarenaya hassleriana TaxID=28532 RepID=UPI00053C6105|nr:PREDICTED: peroxidase 69-like [Tarenaya hassleriana]
MARAFSIRFVLVTFLVMAVATWAQPGRGRGGGGPPRPGFYGGRCRNVETIVRSVVQSHFRCRNVETIVRSVVQSHLQSDPRIAPGILRMQFHDCFVHGCDGSVLINGTNSERTAGPNRSLRGFEVIDDAKARLEAACPNTVSCADILALAARDVVFLTGGPAWPVPLGRLDGRISQASDVNLPSPFDSVAVQKQDFAAKNLNTLDLVTLVGGHTLGTAGCGVVRNRFFNFNNTGSPDPSINPSFVPQIQAQCPLNGDATTRVALDTGSEGRFDTSFLSNVRAGRGVLQSDQVLWSDPETRAIIERFLGLRRPVLAFGPQFARSMIKMSLTEVKTGSDGEIRRVCSAVN